MSATAILLDSVKLQYDHNIQLVMDVCQDRPTTLKANLLSMYGTFTWVMYKRDLPCHFDSSSAVCTVAEPQPVLTCTAELQGKQQRVVVNVCALGGHLVANNTYVGEFKFSTLLQS